MKSVIRIFNFIIMGISGLAIALLFISSTFSLNSRVSFDTDFINQYFNQVVEQIQDNTPTTGDPNLDDEEYINTFDVGYVLGTDHINLSIKFDLSFSEINTIMGNAERDLVNQELIEGNVHGVFDDLHEPVEILTEYTVRTILKSVAKKEIYKQLKNALEDAGSSDDPIDFMDEVGMNDSYFRGFAKTLYDTANNKDPLDPSEDPDRGCSVNRFTDTIFDKLKEVLREADAATDGAVSEDSLTEEMKDEIKNGFISIIETAGLLQEDGLTFVKISQVSYVMLAKILKENLSTTSTISPEELEQNPGETKAEYAERLSKLFVYNMLPDVFYQIIGYVCLGMFIAVLVFAGIWGILFLITILRTFSSEKPWTIFGPWFWIIGSLQVVLGLALTIFCKFYLSGLSIIQKALQGSPFQSFVIAPRTSALIPSMIFLGMIIFAIVYTIMAHSVKKEYKNKLNRKGPKPTEVIINE